MAPSIRTRARVTACRCTHDGQWLLVLDDRGKRLSASSPKELEVGSWVWGERMPDGSFRLAEGVV